MARRRLLKSYFYLKYDGVAYGEAVTVSPFNATGGTDTFEVTSYRPWTVISKPSWLTLSTESGDKGTTIVTITASANPDVDIKTGDIVIKTNTYKYTGTVTCSIQGSSAFVLVNGVSVLSQTIDSDTTTVQYTVTSKGGWTFSSEGSVPCTSDVQSVSDTGDTTTTVTITYGENTSLTADKTFIARFTSNQTGGGTAEVDVTQKPKSNVVLERTTNVTIPYDGMVGAINVTANTPSVNLTLPALITVSENPVTKPAGTPGYEYTKQITFTAATLNPAQTATTGYTYILTGTTDDGKASDTVSFHYEPYPYLDINQSISVDSATTTGVSPFTSNYPVSGESLTPGLEITFSGNQVNWTITEPSSWSSQTYQFKVYTTDIEGTPLEKTVTVTKDADVAYLTINPTAQTVAYPGRSFAITGLSTNDDYTVTIPAEYSSWLTYDPTTGLFTVQENPEGYERVASGITFTTVHNGSAGVPVSVEVKITQTGRNVEAILVVLDMKQNSAGTWYIMTTNADNVNIPITLSNNGNDFATTSDGRVYSASPFTTAVGTNIGTVTGTEQYVSGGQIYNISYQVNSSVPYSETISERVPTSVSLVYDDYVFLANGSASTTAQNSHISAFTVNYEEHITNSFDNTVRTVSKTLQGPEHLSAISGTASNGGSLVSGTFDVAATNRDTTTGNSWTVYTITGFSYVLEGDTLSASTSLTFTQEANTASDVRTGTRDDQRTATGQTSNDSYQNIAIATATTGGTTFAANGKNNTSPYTANAFIQMSATETGNVVTETTTYYNVTTIDTWERTYTSGVKVTFESAGTPYSDSATTSSTTSYSQPATYVSSSTAWLTYSGASSTSANRWAKAPDRGTTQGAERSGYFTFKAEHDSSVQATISFTQLKNEENCVPNGNYRTRGDSGSTTTEISNHVVSIDANAYAFAANGKTSPGGADYATITATETWRVRTATDIEYYRDTGYTCTWSSGRDAGEYYLEGTSPFSSGTIYSSYVSCAATPTITYQTTGNSMSYNNLRVTASDLGTTETTSNSNRIILTATSTFDSTTDTVTLTQEANTSSIENCVLDVSPTMVILKDGQRTSSVTITSYTVYEYTSGSRASGFTMPSVTVSGDSTNFGASTPTFNLRTGTYSSTVSVSNTYTGLPGVSLPLAYAIYSSPNCPGTSDSVDLCFSGAQQTVYPTVTAGTYKAETYWGVHLDFNTNLATTGVQWSCGGGYQVTVTEPWSSPVTYQGDFQITGHCDEFGEVVIDNVTGQYIEFDKEETTLVWLRDTRTMSLNSELSQDYAYCSQPGGL